MNKSKSILEQAVFRYVDVAADGSFPVFIASLGGVGKSPFAPATVATALVGIPCAWLLGLFPVWAALLIVLALFAVSCYVSDLTEKALGVQDPQLVVIDELAGFLVTMVALPLTPLSLGAGFLAFRLFDIWKPWPIRALHERLHGGAAIVLDDIGAGVYAHILVWAILKIYS